MQVLVSLAWLMPEEVLDRESIIHHETVYNYSYKIGKIS